MDTAPPPTRPSLIAARVSRPLVGVTASFDRRGRLRTGAEYWYLNRNYTRALLRAGAAPIILSPDTPADDCASHCEALVLSGGGDLPARLGPGVLENSWAATVPGEAEALERIAWERALLDAFVARGRPVLGVCFGMQLMNLHFGGTLLVNLAQRKVRGLDHGSPDAPTTHALRVAPESQFFANWQPPPRVSSSHRQAVAGVAPGFSACVWAEDGVVEAIERGPLVGVEWHPESDDSGSFVYAKLVTRALQQR